MDDSSNTSYGGQENESSEMMMITGKEDVFPINQPSTFNSQIANSGHISNSLLSSVISSETLESLNPNQLTANAQANIPPLMSIHHTSTNVTTLPTDTTTPNLLPANNPVSLLPQVEAAAPPQGITTMDGGANLPLIPAAVVTTAGGGSSTTVVSLGKPKVSHGKVMDGISPHVFTASEGDTDNDDGGFQKKVPILRLKKKHMSAHDHDDNATFERQEISKNDSYCWVCHDGGDVLCCDKCPRVFHIQCSGLPKAPEGDEEWFCPVCKNIARKTKRSRPTDLKELLLLAVSRMMFPGTEIFQSPVPSDIMVHYREYVFHPLDLGTIRKKVMSGVYQSTRQFTHDTEWILHNCIIYNGKHALSKIAKGIIKVCKEDMREIELCPGCYKLTVKQPKDWFCVPCNPPHPVVLAKVRGYPLWPAKLISETSDKCDVRFFGQHDRSLVQRSCISELVGLPPKPSTKTQHWNIAMFELKRYGENIEEMRSQLSGGKLPGKTIRVSKQHDLKTLTPDPNHLGNSLSNHLSASPAVVEVSPSGVHNNSSDRSNLGTFSEPSSPDTPPGLQIDLEDPTLGGKHHQSPNKMLGMLNAIERNSQVPGSLDFGGDTGPQSVTLPSPTAGISKIKRGNKGRKAGDMLSQLVSSLAERQRMGVVTPGSSPVVLTSGGVIASFDNLEPDQPDQILRDEMDDSGTPTTAAVDINPAFSSIYADRNKTAVYEVDPSGKRDRKRKKPGNDSTPPQAKKPARTAKVSPSKSVSLNDSMTDSPQIHVATSEVVKLGRMTAADRVPPSVSPQPQLTVPGISGHVTAAGSSIIVGPKTPSKSNRSANPAKKRSKPKGNKGSKTSLAGRTSTTHTPSIAPSPSMVSQHEQNTAIITSAGMAKPTTSIAADTRMEEAAQRMGAVANEMDTFQEGTGLLADTIRKVNSSFHARLNQMAGGSEDMGYQYFMEKLMSSVKTVLIEMLSTFDAKSRLSAKQLKDQLHTCWPVPNSRVALDQLQKELRDEMKQSLEVVRASAALELEQVVNEVKRQVEKEKEIAVIETKKKKWCTYCMNEAQYNCCWNANYCNEVCQQAHWPEHVKECTQIQQVPRTPGLSPSELPLPVPVSKPSTPQIATTGHSMSSGGNSMAANQEATQQSSQHQQQGAYMFVNSSAAAMAAAVQAHAQAQRQSQSMIAGMAGGSPALPQQALSSAPGNLGGPHSMHISSSQHGGHTSHSHTPHAHSSTPIVEGMGQQQQQQHVMDHGTPSENTASRMEHLPSENILNTTAAASPPNHIRSLFLSQNQQQAQQQQQQQQARMNTESPALSLVGAHQGGPSTPNNQMQHHGVASTPIGMADNSSLSSVSHHSQHQNSDHSHSSNSSILLHAQSPISPAIPHSETQSTVHNYWPSYQPQLLIGNENYRHLLPTMQVNTSSGQNQTFFRAAY